MDQYESDVQAIKTQFETTNNLPDLFCQMVKQLERLPPEIHNEEIQKQVQELFLDVNTEIQRYNEQFQLLVRELGVLCKQDSPPRDVVHLFFQALLDLFRLASSVYQTTPEKLTPFLSLLHQFRTALETKQWPPLANEGDTFQMALLYQLLTYAWVLTRTEKDLSMYAKTLQRQLRGGKGTRKIRR
jgi:hypothetical protein